MRNFDALLVRIAIPFIFFFAGLIGHCYAITFDIDSQTSAAFQGQDLSERDITVAVSRFTVPTSNHSDIRIRFESKNMGRLVLRQTPGQYPGQLVPYLFTVRAEGSPYNGTELIDVDLGYPQQITVSKTGPFDADTSYQMIIKLLKNSAAFRGVFSDRIIVSVLEM
ncbi:hypothetical protein EBR57_07380 [bacterium]|nr:hypothetical protein [bacterium]